MLAFVKKLRKQQEGQSLVLLALTLSGLMAMLGLVIDGGTLYVTHAQLQKAANAAVLSGAQNLTYTKSSVTGVVYEVLAKHNETDSLKSLKVKIHSDPYENEEHKNRVSIQLHRSVNLSFMGIFGMKKAPVEAKAAAELFVMGSAMGAAPLGIDDSIPLIFNTEYQLKVDQTGVEAGNFGILALGNAGAQTYEYNLMYGYQQMIKINDVFDTQTGNIAGKTRTSINYRISNSPYPDWDGVSEIHRDDPRLILIPTYKPETWSTNQLSSIRVTGFAYFYITRPMSANDTAISGMFVEHAGTGFADPAAVNKGAYAIKLTE